MKRRLVIIGDSFALPVNDESFYGYMLRERFPDLDVIFDGDSSRDAQTIIDHWIKVISELTPVDYLIVIFPALGRTRLPLEKDHWRSNYVGTVNLENRFRGTDSYNSESIETFGVKPDKKYFYNLLIPQMIINASRASEDNFLEVVRSLGKLTQSKKYLFCWREMLRPDLPFDDKRSLTGKMGKWITLHSEFVATDGERGFKDDLHWARETHEAFTDFIVEEFRLI